MRVYWWARLALLSAIAGFVLSGPPPDFEHSDFASMATASLNDLPVPLPVAETIEKKTELVATEFVDEQARDSETISPQAEDQVAATAP